MQNSVMHNPNISHFVDPEHHRSPRFYRQTHRAVTPSSVKLSISYLKLENFKKFISHPHVNRRLTNLNLFFISGCGPLPSHPTQNQLTLCTNMLRQHANCLKKIALRYYPDNTINNRDVCTLGQQLALKSNLHSVNLSFTNNTSITDESILNLIRNLKKIPHLQDLSLRFFDVVNLDDKRVVEALADQIHRFSHLRSLELMFDSLNPDFAEKNIDDTALQKLLQGLHGCELQKLYLIFRGSDINHPSMEKIYTYISSSSIKELMLDFTYSVVAKSEIETLFKQLKHHFQRAVSVSGSVPFSFYYKGKAISIDYIG